MCGCVDAIASVSTLIQQPTKHIRVSLKYIPTNPFLQVPDPSRPGVERGRVIVGDDTGVVALLLDSSQTSLAPGFTQVGSELFLRNIAFDMSEGYLNVILDSFGKVAAPTAEEMSQFNFTVDKTNDVSATEYEKFFHNGGGTPAYPAESNRRGGRGGGYRGGAPRRAY